jgi:F0F1-type ATP synthase membrane subunit b/b'
VVITNPGERDKISDRLESGARKIDADRKFVENNQGKDVEESKKELLKTKNKLSDIENKIKNAERELAGIIISDAGAKLKTNRVIKNIETFENDLKEKAKEISKAEDNLEKVENKYNNKMEKVNSDSKDFLDSAKKTINDIIHTQKESIEANLDYQKVLIKESVGQSTLTSGDASREEKAGNSVITKTSAEQVDAGGT